MGLLLLLGAMRVESRLVTVVVVPRLWPTAGKTVTGSALLRRHPSTRVTRAGGTRTAAVHTYTLPAGLYRHARRCRGGGGHFGARGTRALVQWRRGGHRRRATRRGRQAATGWLGRELRRTKMIITHARVPNVPQGVMGAKSRRRAFVVCFATWRLGSKEIIRELSSITNSDDRNTRWSSTLQNVSYVATSVTHNRTLSVCFSKLRRTYPNFTERAHQSAYPAFDLPPPCTTACTGRVRRLSQPRFAPSRSPSGRVPFTHSWPALRWPRFRRPPTGGDNPPHPPPTRNGDMPLGYFRALHISRVRRVALAPATRSVSTQYYPCMILRGGNYSARVGECGQIHFGTDFFKKRKCL